MKWKKFFSFSNFHFNFVPFLSSVICILFLLVGFVFKRRISSHCVWVCGIVGWMFWFCRNKKKFIPIMTTMMYWMWMNEWKKKFLYHVWWYAACVCGEYFIIINIENGKFWFTHTHICFILNEMFFRKIYWLKKKN